MSSEKSNFKYFLDWLGDHWPIPVIIVFLVFGLLGVGPCAAKASAACNTYEVQPGDTLRSISERFYGTDKHWQDLAWHNELQNTRLEVGQLLTVYVPDDNDWQHACQNIVARRMLAKGQLHAGQITYMQRSIVDGINRATKQLLLFPKERVEACRWAVTTAEHETFYQWMVGQAGEIGIYQFKLDTVRLTLGWYNIEWPDRDIDITQQLMDYGHATHIFVLHLHTLYERYGKDLWLAWRRYNGHGRHAANYASRILERYRSVKRVPAFTKCPTEE